MTDDLRHSLELSDDEMVTEVIEIVRFMNKDGQRGVTWRFAGFDAFSAVLGTMEDVKLRSAFIQREQGLY